MGKKSVILSFKSYTPHQILLDESTQEGSDESGMWHTYAAEEKSYRKNLKERDY